MQIVTKICYQRFTKPWMSGWLHYNSWPTFGCVNRLLAEFGREPGHLWPKTVGKSGNPALIPTLFYITAGAVLITIWVTHKIPQEWNSLPFDSMETTELEKCHTLKEVGTSILPCNCCVHIGWYFSPN